MSDFNLANVTSMLGKIASTATMLTPFAGMLGIGKNITDLLNTGIEIGKNVLSRVDDAQVIATSNDREELVEIINRLEAENAKLDEYIRNN